ncbi:MAG: hypothetical protein HYY30_12635 [Chloroflexi bacterium]|nr:hypothetical protein [Chloroflexota bacterium]
MALMAMVIPILPGKTEQWRRFTEELRGPRARDYAASRQRLGVRERAFIQSIPQGDMIIVTVEGDNPVAAFQRFGASNDDFTKWFVQQVKEIHGLDLSSPSQWPMPEMVLDSQAMGLSQR